MEIVEKFKSQDPIEKITIEEMTIAMEYNILAPFMLHNIALYLNIYNILLSTHNH
jgi:hypothetical protein